MASVTIIIGCLQRPLFGTSIKYISSHSHELYLIGRAPLFLHYLELVLHSNEDKKVSVLLVHDDISILVEVLDKLRNCSSAAALQATSANYISHYRNRDVSRHTNPPQGHNDLPTGYQLSIIQDCDGLDRTDHLSERYVAQHQLLRFIALLHGASYAAVSGLGNICQDTALLTSFAADIYSGLELQVYDVEGHDWGHKVHVHHTSVIGWDSWSKIEVVARATLFDSADAMYNADSLLELYNAFMEHSRKSTNKNEKGEPDKLETLLWNEVSIPPRKPPCLSYSDVVARVAMP